MPRVRPAEEQVPIGVRAAAAWSWRLLVIAAAGALIVYVIADLQLVLAPVAIAVLLAGLLQPVAAWLRRRGLPQTLAALIVLFGGIGVVAGVLSLAVAALSQGFGDLADSAGEGIDQVRTWLTDGPLNLSQRQLDDLVRQGQDSLSNNRDTFTSGALSTALTLGHLVTGLLLMLFTLFFLLRDGRVIWLWLVGLLPHGARHDVDGAASIAWKTLISYVRATGVVAFSDAAGVGIGLAILGVPLALPLAAVVFIGAFIPIIGAFTSGLLAVLVALVSNGPITALAVLALIVVVMQVEGHLLQPLLLGRAVKVHPLAVIIAIAAGLLVGGIIGALIAVPLVACGNVATIYLVRGRYAVAEAPIAGDVDPAADPAPDPAVDPPAHDRA